MIKSYAVQIHNRTNEYIQLFERRTALLSGARMVISRAIMRHLDSWVATKEKPECDGVRLGWNSQSEYSPPKPRSSYLCPAPRPSIQGGACLLGFPNQSRDLPAQRILLRCDPPSASPTMARAPPAPAGRGRVSSRWSAVDRYSWPQSGPESLGGRGAQGRSGAEAASAS